MNIKDNSIVDTIIEYANVKFGLELTGDYVSSQLKNISFSETLKLVDAIKKEDDEAFSNIIDLSAANESLEENELMAMIHSRDPVEQTYAEILTHDAEQTEVGDFIGANMTSDQILKLIDMLEPQGYDKDFLLKDLAPFINEAPSYGPSRATVRAQGTDAQTANRRANNSQQDGARDSSGAARTVAGSSKTNTGGPQGYRPTNADPDDVERANNAQTAGNAQQQANYNSQEIERLKQLIQGR